MSKTLKKILVIPAVVLALTACKDDNKSTAVSLPTVEAIKVIAQDIPLDLEYSARTQGSKETIIRARVNGILIKRNYVEGSKVNEGDVLFEIDHQPYQIALEQAKAKLSQTQAQLTAAESQWKRIEALFKKQIVSEKSRDEAKANLESLQAQVKLAEAEVEAAQLNLDYTTVKAPIAGVTSMEALSEGSLVSVNDALTTVTQLDPIYVNFSASENELFKLTEMAKKGKIVNSNKTENERKILAKVYYNNGQPYGLKGEVDFINPSIDETTGTFKLRATFANPKKELIPGQFVRMSLDDITYKNALAIPQGAVMQGAKGAFVYVVEAENKVKMKPVETGIQTKDEKWIIETGLNAGDIVVTNGLLKLHDGMSVQVTLKDDKAETTQK